MSQALFKGFICMNSFNSHSNALEAGAVVMSILKMKKLRHRELCSAIHQTIELMAEQKPDLRHN